MHFVNCECVCVFTGNTGLKMALFSSSHKQIEAESLSGVMDGNFTTDQQQRKKIHMTLVSCYFSCLEWTYSIHTVGPWYNARGNFINSLLMVPFIRLYDIIHQQDREQSDTLLVPSLFFKGQPFHQRHQWKAKVMMPVRFVWDFCFFLRVMLLKGLCFGNDIVNREMHYR